MADSQPMDGRRARTVRTRERILGAMLELLDEGRPAPTAADIAQQAGVAVRSIAQHFATREKLLLAVAERHASRLEHLEAPPAVATFEARLKAFLDARCRSLEESASIRHAAVLGAASSKSVRSALDRIARQRREELKAAFGDAWRRASPAARAAAEALASGAAWDELRHQQSLPVPAARLALEVGLKKVLAG